jgi:hypothetical protein
MLARGEAKVAARAVGAAQAGSDHSPPYVLGMDGIMARAWSSWMDSGIGVDSKLGDRAVGTSG